MSAWKQNPGETAWVVLYLVLLLVDLFIEKLIPLNKINNACVFLNSQIGVSMESLPRALIEQHRAYTFSLSTEERVRSKREAIAFVNQRGFIFFWPIKGVTLPNLWSAVAGDRPVADAHDDPGHITWNWKDSLLGKGLWYYAKILRKKSTIVALDILPYFYALSENYGSPAEDYLTKYERGCLTQEAKAVYEILFHNGPIDTIALRRLSRLSGRSNESRFNRAMVDLQADFKIMPVGVTKSGGWRYAFAYDVVTHVFPEIIDQASPISEAEARKKLAGLYFASLGAAQIMDVKKLFQWPTAKAESTIHDLMEKGMIYGGYTVEGVTGEWFVCRELVSK